MYGINFNINIINSFILIGRRGNILFIILKDAIHEDFRYKTNITLMYINCYLKILS
jgi:hypothetical protein